MVVSVGIFIYVIHIILFIKIIIESIVLIISFATKSRAKTKG
jgi:hypothetical protein